MPGIGFTIFSFLGALAILIAVHEFGHFWVARRCGVKVLRFSIGFGMPLLRWVDKYQTEFVIAIIPLGGYVKMLDEREGAVTAQERHLAFNTQPVFKRIAIVIAGPLFNILFAILAFWMMFSIGVKTLAPIIGHVDTGTIAAKADLRTGDEVLKINNSTVNNWRDFQFTMLTLVGDDGASLDVKSTDGERRDIRLNLSQWALDAERPLILDSLGIEPYLPTIPMRVGKVVDGSRAQLAGFKSDDEITHVNGQRVQDWRAFVNLVKQSPNKVIQIKLNRQDDQVRLNVTPKATRTNAGIIGIIGLQSKPFQWPDKLIRNDRHPIYLAWWPAVKETGSLTLATFRVIWKLFVGDVSLRTISGPIGIAQGAGQTASIGFAYYLGFLALISISLGVLNILPIPMLDGGHLLFYLIEIIRGKPVSEEAQILGTKIGIVALLTLMGIALYNDIGRLMN